MAKSGSPFLDVKNRYRTRSLFKETHDGDSYYLNPYEPIFTLDKPEDTPEGLVSVYRLYMEANDPSEYIVANRMLGDVHHWKLLCQQGWFRERLDLWRAELENKIACEAMQHIREQARTQYAPAKWLVENDIFEPRKNKVNTNKVGRPRKVVEEPEVNVSTLREDLERMGV